MKVEDIAKICHEANRAYCESLGDFSQVPWEVSPAWQQESTIHGVEHRLKNPGLTPEQNHTNWANEKLRQGWTYGPKKDAVRKIHPGLLPYSELPDHIKTKDKIFLSVVDALKEV